MNTVSHKYRQSALLLLTAAIWGSAFVAQQTGMDYVGPFTFNAARNLLGGLTLLPLIVFFSSRKKRTLPPDASSENGTQPKTLWAGGILCGIALFVASTLQQIGIQYTTVGKAGFITALYIVLVPVCGFFPPKACTAEGLARSSYCRRWSLSALYDRRLLLFAEGRFSCACLRARIYRTYSGY